MVHYFNIEIATKYGIEEAILIENLYFWINKNGANKVHLHDGRYWTYNSRKAFSELFPYINESKIKRVFDLLCNGKRDKDNNIIISPILIKGNFNKNKFDQIGWYAFSDYGISLLNSLRYKVNNLTQNDVWIGSKCTNGEEQNDQTIPDNKQSDNKQKEDNDKSLSKKVVKFDVRKDLSYVNEQHLAIWNKWLDYKDAIKKQYKTEQGARTQYKSLVKYADNDNILMLSIVLRSIENSWEGLFALKDSEKKFYLSDKNPYLDEYNATIDSKQQDGLVNSKGEIWSEQLGKWLK